MEHKTNGWVIHNPKHPANEKAMFFPESFRVTRKEAIQDFIKGSGNPWEYWRKKMNFRCVKAESTVKILGNGS